MLNSELKDALATLEVTQADFARLVGVTPRAVTLWLAGERAVAGSVEAYVRLLLSLPLSQRQAELARLRNRKSDMRDGMYGIEFNYQGNRGVGALVFQEGQVFGADEAGVKYDGDYVFHDDPGLVDVKLKVTYPPNVRAVFGVANPYEWSIDVTASFHPKQDAGEVTVSTSVGPKLKGSYRFLRSLPNA